MAQYCNGPERWFISQCQTSAVKLSPASRTFVPNPKAKGANRQPPDALNLGPRSLQRYSQLAAHATVAPARGGVGGYREEATVHHLARLLPKQVIGVATPVEHRVPPVPASQITKTIQDELTKLSNANIVDALLYLRRPRVHWANPPTPPLSHSARDYLLTAVTKAYHSMVLRSRRNFQPIPATAPWVLPVKQDRIETPLILDFTYKPLDGLSDSIIQQCLVDTALQLGSTLPPEFLAPKIYWRQPHPEKLFNHNKYSDDTPFTPLDS